MTTAEVVQRTETLGAPDRWRIWRFVCPTPHELATLPFTDTGERYCPACLTLFDNDTGCILNIPRKPLPSSWAASRDDRRAVRLYRRPDTLNPLLGGYSLLDVSAGGFALTSREALSVGEERDFAFLISPGSRATVRGRAAHSRPITEYGGPPAYVVGFSFVDTPLALVQAVMATV